MNNKCILLACVMICGLHAADMSPSQAFADALLGHGSPLRTNLLEEFNSNDAADDLEFYVLEDTVPTQAAFEAEIDELRNALAAYGDNVSQAFDRLTAYVHQCMQAGGYWKALRNYHEEGVPAPFDGDPEEAETIAQHLSLSKVMLVSSLGFLLDGLTLPLYLEHLVPADERAFFTSSIGYNRVTLFEFHAVVAHVQNLRNAGVAITQAIVNDSFRNMHDDYMCSALDGTDDAMLAQWNVEALVPWTHVVPAGAGA